ncbi:MAG: MMPL family transporter [Bacteroidales bacterium]|nr:MMPL family transporter [Bacteroidales bacterium]
MKKFATVVISKRQWILFITGIFTLFFAWHIPKLKVNPDVISYLPKDDYVAMLFDSIGQTYQGNTTAVVGYKCDDVFTEKSLKELKAITDTLKYFPGISSVNSLINVIDIREEDSVLQVVPLIDEYNIPSSKKELDSLKNYVLSKNIYRGMLISNDAQSTVITAKIQPDFKIKRDSLLPKDSVLATYVKKYPEPMFHVEYNPKTDTIYVVVNKTIVANALKDKLLSMKLDAQLFFGGLPYITSDIGSIIAHDIVVLGIIAFIIILIVLYVSFKSWRGVLMPVLAVCIAIVWVLGFMALLGFEITMVTNAAPVVLLATGSAYTIHVINRIMEVSFIETSNIKDIIIKALSYVAIPVFFAAVTTMIGFISFIFGSYLVMIAQFGIFTALGVLLSFIIAITFVPAFLSYFPIKHKPERIERRKQSPLNIFLQRLYEFSINHKKSIIATWLVIIVFMGVGITNLERRVDLMDYFKENYPIKKTEHFLRQTFGGTSYLYINFKADIQQLQTLQVMDSVQQFLKTLPSVTHTLSVVDIIKEMNNVMGEGKKLPNTQEKVYNLWFLIEGQEIMSQLVANNNSEALVQATINTSDSKIMAEMVTAIDKYMEKYKNAQIKYYQSGFPSIYKRLDESLINSQLYSLIIAIILVYFIVSFILKSLKNGLFAVVPILATVAVLFGVMGWLHIPLDVATVLVASVSMGIGIDYAIHLINHVTYEQNSGLSYIDSIRNAVTISGRAILINVLSVTLGFLVMLFSDLVPLQRFGLLIAVTMITSGLTTLTLLVALLNLNNQKSL